MKKTRIVLIISSLILISLIVVFVITSKDNKGETVSIREQYQKELIEKEQSQSKKKD